MAGWLRRGGGDDEDDLESIFDKAQQNVNNPAGLVFWCRRALRHRSLPAADTRRAILQLLLAQGLLDSPEGDRRKNQEEALKELEKSASYLERSGDHNLLASALNKLGLAWNDRLAGNKNQNIERSLSCHSRGLTTATDPKDRGMAAYNLARRYRARIEGDAADNLESAITNAKIAAECYSSAKENALWADAMSLLRGCYTDRRVGDRQDNLAQADSYSKAAFNAFKVGSSEWIDAGLALGTAYAKTISGDQVEDLERAVNVLKRVVRATGSQASGKQRSAAYHALGIAYQARLAGDRSENIELAISYLAKALHDLDPETERENWQITHQSLAACYDYRLAGDRGVNLDRAVEHLTVGLGGRADADDPQRRAMLQQSLALVYLKRATARPPRGDRKENLRLARNAIEDVLRVRTQQADPAGWARAAQTEVAILEQEKLDAVPPEPEARGQDEEVRIPDLERDVAALRTTCQSCSRTANPELWANSRIMLERKLGELAHATDPDGHWDERADLLRGALEVHTPNSDPALCALAAISLGKAYAALGQWPAAADAFCLAVQASEVQAPTALTVLGRRHQRQPAESAPRLASYCLAKSGRLTDAVAMLERGLARTLGDALDRDYARLDVVAREHPKAHSRYRDAAVRLRRLQDAEHPSGAGGQALTELASRIRAAREDLDRAVRRIRQLPGYEDFLTESKSPALDDMVTADTPIAYLNTTPWGSAALLVSRGQTVTVTPLWADFTDADLQDVLHRSASEDTTFPFMAGYYRILYNIVETRFASGDSALTFGSLFNDAGAVHRTGREELVRLDIVGERIIRPLAAALAERRPSRLVLIPCGLLSLLPLHTIAYADRRCLIDDLAVSYAPSARVMLHARLRAAELASSGRTVLAGVGNPLPHPQPLWFATRELSEVSTLFDEATCLYGEEATKDRLLDAARTATHVHLACHGAVPFARDQSAYLQLAGDERLGLEEIARRLPFPAARLVVLSACQSALINSVQETDEAIGLPTAVMLSGTPGVVGSLWAANDLATSLLMKRFYDVLFGADGAQGLGANGSPSQPWAALRRAQRWLSQLTAADLRSLVGADPALGHLAEENRDRSSGAEAVASALGGTDDPDARPFADPYYWAPFVYIGE